MPKSYYANGSEPLPEEFVSLLLIMDGSPAEPHLCEETPDVDGYYWAERVFCRMEDLTDPEF